ncbi:unnamed protein product [Penicillium camemberti]|uniref:Str. FM013 n=1 Tax=Penicillium camemberti (strain FM 013) TaxID=1429867 RepID=A0A0G4P9F9_PENC3|nr:unnamed protein product [Penicillium camemberti]
MFKSQQSQHATIRHAQAKSEQLPGGGDQPIPLQALVQFWCSINLGVSIYPNNSSGYFIPHTSDSANHIPIL